MDELKILYHLRGSVILHRNLALAMFQGTFRGLIINFLSQRVFVFIFLFFATKCLVWGCCTYSSVLQFQIEFSPRRLKGYGLTDGEGIERLWSYLRGFSSMTKEMTAGRRTDILTDALLHYSSRQLRAFGNVHIRVFI